MRALPLILLVLSACGHRRGTGGDGDGDGEGDGDADGDGLPCDRDGDAHESLDCGGDDCDDAAAGVHPGAPDAIWEVERLGQGGEWISFVLGADGAHHLVVGQGLYGIQYLTDASGTWTTEVIDAQRYQGHQTGLALDAAGAAHVVWVPEATRVLQYATNASGAWTTETIDSAFHADYPCVAVDAAGEIHVAYEDQDSFDVHVAARAGGAWRTEPLGARGMGLAMALAPDGAVHLAWGNPGGGGGAPSHASNESGAWVVEGTGAGYPNGAGAAPTIAVGEDGVVHVAWVVPSEGGLLRASSNETGAFVEEDVTPLGSYGGSPSLAIDAAGLVHLAATSGDDWARTSLLHALRGDAGWVVQPIAAGRGAFMRFDAEGTPAILFATTDFELAIAHHTFADGIDDDCDGQADRHSQLPLDAAPTTLSDDDAAALCGWAIELQGGEGARHTCGDVTVTAGGIDACVATRGMCPTVEAFEGCMLAIAADVCALSSGLPPPCAACSSGVEPTRTLSELTASEWQAWCTWSISTQGGEGKSTTCPNGSVQVGTVSECVTGSPAFAACGVTVAEADACSLAMAEDACTGMDAPPCAALVTCLLGGF